ncbi:MAG: disulfide bond formation protein B [Planctomycetia bacterium]
MDLLKRDLPYSVALALALLGSAGSVWLSVGMGLKACPLCFYQRTAVFLVLAGLVLGLVSETLLTRGTAAWLVLPACVLGLLVAGWHVYLESSGALECPKGMLGLGTAPLQSLVAFLLLTSAVGLSALRATEVGTPRLAMAAVLGLLLGFAAVKSAPPMPAVPKQAYPDPLVTCRPPFPGA